MADLKVPKNVAARLDELGCTIEGGTYGGRSMSSRPDLIDYLDATVDAPDGKVFAGEDLHSLAVIAHTKADVAAAWNDLLWRISDGLEDCTDSECDSCRSI